MGLELGVRRWGWLMPHSHLLWPKALKVHQARGALKMPAPSYITIWLSLLMLRLSMAAANRGPPGSMWGRDVAVSATLSMSKYWAPGMRALRNSASPSRPAGAGG